MFLRRLVFRPLPGKGPALREVLRSGQRSGRWNLAERLVGPSPELRLQFFYESLSDMQQAIEAAQGQQPPAELASLAAAAPALELEELLTPPPTGSYAYVSRAVFAYAPGKLREARAVLEEVMQRRAAAGGTTALALRVSGGPGALMLIGFYNSLADLEATRATALADQSGAERLQRLSALLAQPAELPEINRIVAQSA